MIGDHYGPTARRATVLVRAVDAILGTHTRLHHRLTALGMPAAARDLQTGVHHWTRMVKLALGR
jgi:hypothetical protein